MSDIFKIRSFRNQTRLNENATEAHIRPLLEIETERAMTLFVSQSIDGMEMFAAVRYDVAKGPQSIFLKTMRVIRPGTDPYRIGIRVTTSAVDEAVSEVFENCILRKA